MTKKQTFDIKKEIEHKRQIIDALLVKRAKHLDDLHWTKSRLLDESLCLHQCPDSDVRASITSECITSIQDAWNDVLHKTNITEFTLHDVIDLHRSLSVNTNIIPGQVRTFAAYSEQLELQYPELPCADVMYQNIDNVLFKLNAGKQPILQRAFNVHYELIALQAFTDHNKRTARMLMNWFLMSKGYRPIFFTAHSDTRDYMDALRMYRYGDPKSYYKYMYTCMSRTQDMFINELNKTR